MRTLHLMGAQITSQERDSGAISRQIGTNVSRFNSEGDIGDEVVRDRASGRQRAPLTERRPGSGFGSG